jgi:hypothetical protein
MSWNDTFGEITAEQLAALRAEAKKCLTCGQLATVDPQFHATRYAHAPVIEGDSGARLEWTGADWEPASDRDAWLEASKPCPRCLGKAPGEECACVLACGSPGCEGWDEKP